MYGDDDGDGGGDNDYHHHLFYQNAVKMQQSQRNEYVEKMATNTFMSDVNICILVYTSHRKRQYTS